MKHMKNRMSERAIGLLNSDILPSLSFISCKAVAFWKKNGDMPK